MRNWEAECRDAGFNFAAEPLIVNETPDDAGLESCKELGLSLIHIWSLGHKSTSTWAGVIGEVPMRITFVLSCIAFLARVTESLQY